MTTATSRLQAQDSTAQFIDRLSREHGSELLRYLRRMVGREEAAEEIARKAYLTLCGHCQPNDIVFPRALLFDVATKLAIARHRAVAPETNDASCKEGPPQDCRALPGETMQRLRQIIEGLQPSLRQVLVMRYVMRMSAQEVADRLRITVGAVEQCSTLALTHCRQRLAAYGIDWVGPE
jgi:RNA polymerase sigma factor (sigma-70 family)